MPRADEPPSQTGQVGAASADDWLDAYGRGPAWLGAGPLIWVCVPLSMVGLTGLLWSLPVPARFSDAAALNWGTIFLMAAVVYYFIVSIPLALGVLPLIVIDVALVTWLDGLEAPLSLSSLALLTFAATTQLVEERLRGRSVRVIRDLQYLMLGPLWLVAVLFRRAGIPY